eukprot:3941413-Rhodomonas_salina.2
MSVPDIAQAESGVALCQYRTSRREVRMRMTRDRKRRARDLVLWLVVVLVRRSRTLLVPVYPRLSSEQWHSPGTSTPTAQYKARGVFWNPCTHVSVPNQ